MIIYRYLFVIVSPRVLITTVRTGHKWMDINSRLLLARNKTPVYYYTLWLLMAEQYDYCSVYKKSSVQLQISQLSVLITKRSFENQHACMEWPINNGFNWSCWLKKSHLKIIMTALKMLENISKMCWRIWILTGMSKVLSKRFKIM